MSKFKNLKIKKSGNLLITEEDIKKGLTAKELKKRMRKQIDKIIK